MTTKDARFADPGPLGDPVRKPPVPGWELGQRLCEALGLDARNVTHIGIDAAHDDVAVVFVTRWVERGEADAIGEIFDCYRLQRCEKEEIDDESDQG